MGSPSPTMGSPAPTMGSPAPASAPLLANENLLNMLSAFKAQQVLVLGDVMLDSYLRGDAERISPEAPVPIVLVEQEEHLLGGSGNVARNIVALEGKATLLGIMGLDSAGEQLQQLLHAEGIVSGLVTGTRPTTRKVRVLARQQQMLRLDYEQNTPLLPLELQQLQESLLKLLPTVQVIILSDYHKGLVCPELMAWLQTQLQPEHKLLVDPKPKNLVLYKRPYLLTPNAKEASECTGLTLHSPTEIITAGQRIFAKTQCKHLLITLGSGGMALFIDPQQVWHIPTVAQAVFDVTGAGDTVIATLGLGLAAGLELLPACILANYAAGLVVAKVGAGVVSPAELGQAITHWEPLQVTRWL